MLKKYQKHDPISPRLPAFMHGADYNPEQWLHEPGVLEEDIRLMKLAGCNVMSVGIFAWGKLEPEEGVYTFEWLDQVLDRLASADIYVWLATPSGARPAWLSETYPEVLRVEKNRQRNLHGMRHNHCPTSPVYREKVGQMNARLAERYACHPAVLGWHVSNEYGGECHCDYCQEAFRSWLKAKYGSLEALNQAWWTTFWSHTYTSWSQVESPAPHGEMMVHGHNLDWRRFVSDQTIDFYRHEIAPLKAVNPVLPCTANMMDLFYGLDYREFAKAVDVVSWDAYPTWHADDSEVSVASWFAFNHDLFRSLKMKPFMLMESTPSQTNWQPVSKLKRPGMHRLSSLQAVAHGSDTVQYFQWRKSRGSSEKFHGAVVDHAGHEHTRVFQDVASLGQTLAAMEDVLGTSVPAEAALLFDWDNRWAVLDAQGPRNGGLHYEETVVQHYRALWQLSVPTDIIGAFDSLEPYKLVIAPMVYLLREETGRKLSEYVSNGGTLLVTYWSGVVNEHDLCHLGGFPGPLREVTGIWAEEIDGLHDHDRNALAFMAGNELAMEGSYNLHELCEVIHTEGAEVLAVYDTDFYKGLPALTVNRFGAGKAYYLAARVQGDEFYESLYARLVADAGVLTCLESSLPKGVNVEMRTDGVYDYVFVLNFSGKEAEVQLDDRAYTELESGITLEERKIHLPPHGSVILKRKAQR